MIDLFRLGAGVFVCGNGVRMAPAAHETVLAVDRNATGASAPETACGGQVEHETNRCAVDVFA